MNPNLLDIQADQRQFYRAAGNPEISYLHVPNPAPWQRVLLQRHARLCFNLIEEEVVKETLPLLDKLACDGYLTEVDIVKLFDGIIDIVYVLMQTANLLKLPFSDGWREVQRSNIAKIGADGLVHRREDGKILKPPGWQEPDLFAVLYLKDESGETPAAEEL